MCTVRMMAGVLRATAHLVRAVRASMQNRLDRRCQWQNLQHEEINDSHRHRGVVGSPSFLPPAAHIDADVFVDASSVFRCVVHRHVTHDGTLGAIYGSSRLTSIRMIGRVGERRATSWNPAFRKADGIPVHAKAAGIGFSTGSTG